MGTSSIQQYVVKRSAPKASGGYYHRNEPMTLLAEYDPYIAGLIRKLQDEVRTERGRGRWHSPHSTH